MNPPEVVVIIIHGLEVAGHCGARRQARPHQWCVVVTQLAGAQAVDGIGGRHDAVGPLPVAGDGVVRDGEACSITQREQPEQVSVESEERLRQPALCTVMLLFRAYHTA